MKIVTKKLNLILVCGVLGCLMMAASDWMMIYGDVSYSGQLAWLTNGVIGISPLRNALALALAFPAVVCYAVALFEMAQLIIDVKKRRIYHVLNLIGMTPWLALHLFYVMILFTFAWMHTNGMAGSANVLCESIFNQFSWVIILSEILMLLPFIYWLYMVVSKQTIFKPKFGFVNPILLYVVLKLLTMLMPNNAFRLAFTNGLMSEAMLIWFGLIFYKAKQLNH